MKRPLFNWCAPDSRVDTSYHIQLIFTIAVLQMLLICFNCPDITAKNWYLIHLKSKQLKKSSNSPPGHDGGYQVQKGIVHQDRFSFTSLASENGPESNLINSGLAVGLVTPMCCGSLARLMASSIVVFSDILLLCL